MHFKSTINVCMSCAKHILGRHDTIYTLVRLPARAQMAHQPQRIDVNRIAACDCGPSLANCRPCLRTNPADIIDMCARWRLLAAGQPGFAYLVTTYCSGSDGVSGGNLAIYKYRDCRIVAKLLSATKT